MFQSYFFKYLILINEIYLQQNKVELSIYYEYIEKKNEK